MGNPSNPYSAPATATKRSSGGPDQQSGIQFDFQPIMKRWELLRLLYNAILILFVLFVTFIFFPDRSGMPLFWETIVFGGMIANVCFFTGPAIEAYARCFRLWHHVASYLLFIAGLLFTAIMAIATIAEFPKF